MNISTKIEFIKKAYKKEIKRLSIIFVILSLIVVIAFSFAETMTKYMDNIINLSYDYLNLMIPIDLEKDEQEQIDELLSIDHVTDVFDQYLNIDYLFVTKIDNTEIDGELTLVGMSKKEIETLSNGKYDNMFDIVCPKNFYPSNDLSNDTTINNISIKDIYNMKNYIDKSITVKLYSQEKSKYITQELKVVETYPNQSVIIDESTCYVSRDLLEHFANINYDSSIIEEFKNNDTLWLHIDAYENIEKVLNDANKMGYYPFIVYDMDNTYLDQFNRFKPISFILVIPFIIMFVIILKKKNMMDKVKNYNILKCIGESDDNYLSMLFLENLIVMSLSLIGSLISILIICILIKLITFVYPFILFKLDIVISFKGLIFYYFLIFSLLTLFTLYYYYKIRKKSLKEY